MCQAEFEEHVGYGNICFSIADALERAKALHLELDRSGLVPVGAGDDSSC
jgi:hypothetical protein